MDHATACGAARRGRWSWPVATDGFRRLRLSTRRPDAKPQAVRGEAHRIMSRTTLCAVTAAGLAALSLGIMAARYYVLGDEIKLPAGPNVWKVTLTVQGRTDGEARLLTASPLDFNRQHVVRETYHSAQLTGRAPDATSPLRRRILWTRKAGVPEGIFKLRGEFICSVDQARPTAPMSRLGQTL